MSENPFPLPLYLTDLNVDRARAYYGVRRGFLTRLVNGVFLNSGLTPEDRRNVVLRNSARIAVTAFSNGILTGSSAFHRGAVEGHLMLATPWGGKPVDVGGVFTIYFTRSQVDVGLNREVEFVSIEDDFGPYSVKRMADEILIIKNFQQQRGRPAATFLNLTDLLAVIERCARVAGSREKLMDRLRALGSHHGLKAYEQDIQSFINSSAAYSQSARPLKSFDVFWHSTQVATLSNDGHIWSFDYKRNIGTQLSVTERPGKRTPPSFLGSILPEVGPAADGTLDERMDNFRGGSRYISNITVRPSEGTQPEVIIDMLEGELEKFTSPKLEFAGRLDRSLTDTAADEAMLSEMQDNPGMPRISGMQVKLAANLDCQGNLSPAIGKAFTHILKVPGGAAAFQTLGSMEWFSLTVAKLCGLSTEQFALIELKGRGPGLLVERFDVRRDLNDTRMILTEDFWSIAGMTDNKQKYTGELIDVADALVKHSTKPKQDGRNLLAQAVFSWLTWNGDMHLKNLLLLKETRDPRNGFESVQLSPIYDMLCTQVYPNDAKSAAISLCGSRHHTLAGFRTLGRKFGMTTEDVDEVVDFLTVSIPMWARRISENLPSAIKDHDLSTAHIERAKALFEIRCVLMIAELDSAKRQSTNSTGADLESLAGTFSGEDFEGVTEHMEAERRRSWSPAATAAQAPVAGRTTARPRP